MTILRQVAVVALGVLCSISLAVAQSPSPVSYLADDVTYDVHADGSWVKDEFAQWRINNEEGIQRTSQRAFSFSSSLEDLEIIEAYTTTPDGARLNVTADKIVLQQSPQSASAPMFADVLIRTVIFPAVSVGSVLTVHVKHTNKTPTFPGHFSISETYSRHTHFLSGSVTLRAAKSLNIHIDARGLAGGSVAAEQADVNEWRWTLAPRKAMLAEPFAVSESDYSPYVAATNFDSPESFAQAYAERAAPKAAVTDAVRKLANQITAGIPDRRGQAEALYRWVSGEIRYVALYLGFGGFVPHSADEIIAARYGDCKDHVTLLEALLNAKGIQSSPALVNAANAYQLPKVAAYTTSFDHVITYLPEFKLFVDSTAQVARFGVLAPLELGKQALVTDDGTGKAALITLPLTTVEADYVQNEMTLTLDEQGVWHGQSNTISGGVNELRARQIFGLIPQDSAQVAGQVLTVTGQSGAGKYTHSDRLALNEPFTYGAEFKLNSDLPPSGPASFMVPRGLGAFTNMWSTFDAISPPQREFPVALYGGRLDEKTLIRLPKSIKIISTPKSVQVANPFGTYESTYVLDGDQLSVRRQLNLTLAKPFLSPAEYATYRELVLAVQRDIKSQILYQ